MKQYMNIAAFVVAVVFSIVVMGAGRSQTGTRAVAPSTSNQLRFKDLPDGRRGLVDATGAVIPIGSYRRIVAGSIVARSALGELCEPSRLVGVIEAGIEDAVDRHRFVGLPRLRNMTDTERLLSLKPDLVIVNALGSLSHIARLRDTGLQVFALGDMRGVATFVRDLRQVAWLVGAPERGERVASGFRRRLDAVAFDIPIATRKRGMYLTAYGSQIFGGTKGTSYHDILTYAGLVDAAAPHYSGWPQYTAEHVLAMDPEVIVAPRGVAHTLCAGQPLARLQACRTGGLVELPSSWLEDPSLIMLDVAETVREAVYGPR